MKHRLFAAIMAVILAAGVCPALAFANPGSVLLVESSHLETEATDDIASGESGTCTWRIDSTGTLIVSPTSGVFGELETRWGYDYDEGVYFTPWHMYRAEITSVRFERTIKAQYCQGMFMNCTQLTSVDLSGLDTSSGPPMTYMFAGCTSLTSLDLSPLDTSNVEGMGWMFSGCTP